MAGTIAQKAKNAVSDIASVPGNIVETGINELENVLDTIADLAATGATTGAAAVGGAEKTADQVLDEIKTHSQTGLDLITEFLHLTKTQGTK